MACGRCSTASPSKTPCWTAAAQEMVADQYRYEIEHGYVLGHYDPADFYEVISEFIRQDTAL